MKTDRSKVKRIPKRGSYDNKIIYSILDKEFICQIGFVHEDHPVVIPTIYGRKEDTLYFHGANVSRMLQSMEEGVRLSINVTRTNALVLARSAFHHSLNYESVTLFGQAFLVEDDKEKSEALQIISNQVLADRWEEVRKPNSKELNVTKVLKFKIQEGSAKIRNEGVGDDTKDYELDIWAGLLPIERSYGSPVSDPALNDGIEISESVKKAANEKL
ncbi:pyridoxamine 5'-phosphate oxidase family protein [Lutimonas zeaxanthinifaciens]|uniref:pyridoxamine 5'-phosphate oxidase family protein n=1 Tax=Lutimonas zeaxanthinifaciens TaxID=3060215 RepID=UPI00265CDC9B|nr:pyridoxamine 5'-phosphate oxidase family protein [Lutimonas sp. YSD2104]WKK65057.1 pyridoxamine 5'-phosphate oxidase family protein [Lutimonas sp. YSD2104]